jgi:hypothetical protein
MIETVGEAFDAGWKLKVKCDRRRAGLKSVRSCPLVHELDLDSLIWTHGWRCPISWLNSHLRCPKCGSRHVLTFWVAPNDADQRSA